MMYEQSARWNEYYRELEPKERRRLLGVLMETEADDGANGFRLKLYDLRYRDEKKPDRMVDRYLFQCVNLAQLYNSSGIFKKGAKKEVERVFTDLIPAGQAHDLGEAGERALYWEIRNAAALYFKTCLDPSYHRSLFGLMRSGDVNRMEQMCGDTWKMSTGLMQRTGLEEQMRIWKDAVLHSFFASSPQAETKYLEYCRNK